MEGLNKHFIPVGKCKKDDFKNAVVLLRDSPRFSQGGAYRILTNNCHTFCDELLSMLGPGVTYRIPTFARFLDDMFGFFIPGGTLQGLEACLDMIGDEEAEGCDRRCFIWTLLGCLGFLLSISVPMVVAVHLSFI